MACYNFNHCMFYTEKSFVIVFLFFKIRIGQILLLVGVHFGWKIFVGFAFKYTYEG